MNPLSPFTYYIRHKGQALLLLVLIGSLTMGVYAMSSIADMGLDVLRQPVYFLSRMSRLSVSEAPGAASILGSTFGSPVSAGEAPDASLAAQIRVHPDVVAVVPENGLSIGVPMGLVVPFPVLGVREADLELVIETCDLRLKTGRLIEPHAGEILLSEELARVLELEISDHVSYDINADYYSAFASELMLVGILESIPSDAGPKVRTGFVSYEYLEAHERYQPRATNWLIVPHPGRRIAVSDFTSDLIAESAGATTAQLQTLESEVEFMEQVQRIAGGMYGFADGVVAAAAALVVGTVHRIAITHRLPELGLLHAAGHRKRRLVRRLVLEVAILACVGWVAGLLCAHTLVVLLNRTFYAAQGWSANLTDPAPFLYTLPTPLAVVGWIAVSISRTLNRLDPVTIVERGKLSMEKDDRRRGRSRSTPTMARNPLASWTFCLRHRRRSILMLATIGLMVLGVALPGFLNAVQWDSNLTLYLSYTSRAAIASPGYAHRAIDPDVVAQIRAHPAVAHTISAKPLSMVVNSPLVGNMFSIPVYAVREQDLPTLLEVYGLHLDEGELVQPRSGQIVLTSALARNRNLSVGDAIGHPVHERDGMPTELTVVGLLESTGPTLVDRAGYDVPPVPRWVGFASYEYVEGHERYTGTPTYLLVVPVSGRESEMEVWLEETIASPRVQIATLGTSYRLWQDAVQIITITYAISMVILTTVAASGLAILNRVFIAQRRDEFGVLHAVGHSRAALIKRTLRESVSITVAAWLFGAAICIASLFFAQTAVYEPFGLSIDFYNPTPWLFTLPIPVAVVAASVGTIGWTLSRLDPVAVIERR